MQGIISFFVAFQIGAGELFLRHSEPLGKPARFFITKRRPDLAAAIGTGCAIDAGPDALCRFPYLPVYSFLVEFALEFHELAKPPVLLFLSLCKRTDLNEIDGHTYKMALPAAEFKPSFDRVFLMREVLVSSKSI